jgi:hypothetical protein
LTVSIGILGSEGADLIVEAEPRCERAESRGLVVTGLHDSNLGKGVVGVSGVEGNTVLLLPRGSQAEVEGPLGSEGVVAVTEDPIESTAGWSRPRYRTGVANQFEEGG